MHIVTNLPYLLTYVNWCAKKHVVVPCQQYDVLALRLQGTQANMVPYLQGCFYHMDVQPVFAGGLHGGIHCGESQTAEPTGAGCLPSTRRQRS